MGRSVGLSGGRIRSAWGPRVVSRPPRSGGEVLLEYAMLLADNPAYGLVEYGFFFLLLIASGLLTYRENRALKDSAQAGLWAGKLAR